MATDLKRTNLMLDGRLLRALRKEARKRRVSMSELARGILARDLGLSGQREDLLASIRALRESVGPMPDSAAIIREARDRGW
jgi:hypothetical protein